MRVLKAIAGIFALIFKLIFELLDPILRYIEMTLNIIFGYMFGWIIDLFALLPSVKWFSLGEGVLSVVFGILSFVFYDKLYFWIPIYNTALRVLFCVGLTIIGYFLLYFVVKFLLNFISSIISLIIVLVRLSIYLPASSLVSFIKILLQVIISIIIFFVFKDYWTNNIFGYVLAILISSVVVSIITLLFRNDVGFNSLGTLGEVELEDLKAFNHSIGIYIMTLGVVPVYIGRAIEFNNGGFRKRLRDYVRDGNSARKHTSGKLINSYKD